MRDLSKRIFYCLLPSLAVFLSSCDAPPRAEKGQAEQAVFWSADAYNSMNERFAAAKGSRSELILFLKKMPKGADLHNHVLGATYSEYVLDAARKNKLNYDKKNNVFTSLPKESGDAIISIDELIEDDEARQNYFGLFSMRGWRAHGSGGHTHFFQTFRRLASGGKIATMEGLAETLSEIAARNIEQNIAYLELIMQIDPRLINGKVNAALGDFDPEGLDAAYSKIRPLLDSQEIGREMKAYFDELEERIDNTLQSQHGYRLLGDESDITLRYSAELQRHDPPQEFFADLVSAMLAVRHDDRVVSLNMVQPEDDPRSLKNFDGQMKMIDFLWSKLGEPLISLHAGELTLSDSPVEAMRDRIRRSIGEGHARRIGHGLSIAWEKDAADLLESMRRQGILVEICLTSNEYISSLKGQDHPFPLYMKAGVPLSLNTDDEGVNRGNLTVEFVEAVRRYDLSYNETLTLARNSLEYSFMPGDSLYVNGDYQNIKADYKDRLEQGRAGLPSAKDDLKLRIQMEFELDLIDFEKEMSGEQ